MPYTSHGHWYGEGEPTEPRPQLVARCGGPGLCAQCSCAGKPYSEASHAERLPGALEIDLLLLRHFGWTWHELVQIPAEMRATIASAVKTTDN